MNRVLLGLVLLVMITGLGIIFSLDHISKQEESIKQKQDLADLVPVNVNITSKIHLQPYNDLDLKQNCWLEILVTDNKELTYHTRKQIIEECGELTAKEEQK